MSWRNFLNFLSSFADLGENNLFWYLVFCRLSGELGGIRHVTFHGLEFHQSKETAFKAVMMTFCDSGICLLLFNILDSHLLSVMY